MGERFGNDAILKLLVRWLAICIKVDDDGAMGDDSDTPSSEHIQQAAQLNDSSLGSSAPLGLSTSPFLTLS